MTDFSKVPWKNIHVIDYGRRYLIDDFGVVYKEPDSSCDSVNHIIVKYSCCDDARCIGFTEEKFKFDGSNICDDDIYLEYVEGTDIPVKEDNLWDSKCLVERIDGTGEPIKCSYVRYFCDLYDCDSSSRSLFCQFKVNGDWVEGSFSIDGLPLCDAVKEYRLIYHGDTNDK